MKECGREALREWWSGGVRGIYIIRNYKFLLLDDVVMMLLY